MNMALTTAPSIASAAALPGCDIQGSILSVTAKRLPIDIDPYRRVYFVANVSITQSSWHGPNAAMGCAGFADTKQSVIVPARAYNKKVVKVGQKISGLMKPMENFSLSFLTGIKSIVQPPAIKALSEDDNHSTISVKKGTYLKLVLHSTYWQMNAPSSDVLRQIAEPKYISDFAGHIPGMGTGTVTMEYSVEKIGKAEITASRTSCGEALLCTGDQGQFSVTIQVTE